MPQHARNTPACRNCGGFPVVAITTGARADDGTRVTLNVTCPTCKGTGHTPRVTFVRAGR